MRLMQQSLASILKRNRKNFYENGGLMYRYNVSDDLSANAVNLFESEMKKEPKKDNKNLEIKDLFEAQKAELEKELEKANKGLDLKKSAEITHLIEMVQGKIIELEQLEKQKEDNEENKEEEEFFSKIEEKYGKVER